MLDADTLAQQREHGVAVNALWPRTTIATAAVQNLLGGDETVSKSRTPAIMADAAIEIFTRDAKRVCSGCSVRAECLEFALANDERFGIWGGLSERERRRLRLQQRTHLSA